MKTEKEIRDKIKLKEKALEKVIEKDMSLMADGWFNGYIDALKWVLEND